VQTFRGERIGKEEGAMTAEENKRLAREGIRIWTTGDFDAADDIYAPDYVNHQHHDPTIPATSTESRR
jgi:hypothetical protein